MADIQAFQALRYDLGHVGSLSDVIAPPYDVIDAAFQDELYKRHPANVVRLILNRQEPGDDDSSRYQRAARFLKNWKNEGVLKTDSQPSIYVYHQTFEVEGQSITRRGFLCRVRLERFGEGRIYPHEETHSAAKADRLKLIRACKTNLSPIFGIYPDPSVAAQEALEEAIPDGGAVQATDHLGVVHTMWPVDDLQVIGHVTQLMGDKPLYIADGHHRYETACNYRDELAEKQVLPGDHPANYALMMFVSMHDDGMIVLPTHRLFRGLPEYSVKDLQSKLGECFDLTIMGNGADKADEVWQQIVVDDRQDQIGLFSSADNTWLLASLNDHGRKKMDELASDRCDAWRSLGVSILQRLLVEHLLGQEKIATPMYVHSIEETVEAIERGDAVGRDATGQEGSGGKFPLVALVMPASLTHIEAVSQAGERMPAKSTYFYPKLLSGLVLNPVE
jgi:uncharacterized protein (DUF1015 family)